MALRALILDFDGLMVDSEMTEYLSWKETYEAAGAHLSIGDWLGAVGYVNGFDPVAHLEFRTSRRVDRQRIVGDRARRAEEMKNALPALPGVRELIDAAGVRGLRLGMASNSTASWVLPSLERLGLRERFAVIRTRESVERPKPAPDLYLGALRDLGVEAEEAVAFEDSEPGVAAAKAAGLRVVAVPNVLTKLQDLSLADERVETLAGYRLGE